MIITALCALTNISLTTLTVDLSEGDTNFNKETLFVKKGETNDAGVSEIAA